MQQVAKQQQQTKEEQQETVEEEVAQETTQYTTVSHIETIETVPVPVQDPIVCCVAVG